MLARYKNNEYALEEVGEFLDLGVFFDTKLSFNSHIAQTVNKAKGVLDFIKRWGKEFAKGVLDFIKRWGKEFDDSYATRQLY